ncbi:CheR family methyltransferase [Reinekea sp.]|jgi:chemotaxis methyl-accepting protein methylase|uniref:CheR family methyltransferase n=1 Tax=Reinekea sp. TaxID=1970455 RepID=UPI002A821192|nr:CheR family methyltransferase [Reinekea sp.]
MLNHKEIWTEWLPSIDIDRGRRFLRDEIYYNLILYPIVIRKQRKLLAGCRPSQSHTYTAFNRSPGQMEALIGPVLDFIAKAANGPSQTPLQINVMAGSIGAEAYTLASTLLSLRPDIDFHIHCSDLHDETVARSIEGIYSADDVRATQLPERFFSTTFDRIDGFYRVKPAIRKRVTFFKADIVTDPLAQLYPPGDILFLQNVLFHLDCHAAHRAFINVLSAGKTHHALFIDGMSLDMRVNLTRQHQLVPLEYKIRAIHQHARRHVPEDWWNYYFGAEPYLFFKPDRKRRYSTIFLTGE